MTREEMESAVMSRAAVCDTGDTCGPIADGFEWSVIEVFDVFKDLRRAGHIRVPPRSVVKWIIR